MEKDILEKNKENAYEATQSKPQARNPTKNSKKSTDCCSLQAYTRASNAGSCMHTKAQMWKLHNVSLNMVQQ